MANFKLQEIFLMNYLLDACDLMFRCILWLLVRFVKKGLWRRLNLRKWRIVVVRLMVVYTMSSSRVC
ncbi:hypothetical protein ACS0TY_012507 [Phlomoides rotata]